jgi:hypothetical protein
VRDVTNINEQTMTASNEARVPGETAAQLLVRLRRQGVKVKEAALLANMSERHAYRMLREFASRPLTLERWSPSQAVGDAPEKIAYLFETMVGAGWSREESDIAWAVHCASPELDPALVKAFCRLYVAADHAGPEAGNRYRMVIDRALWHEPWRGEDEFEAFIEEVPVVSKEELAYAAEVARYLERHAPAEEPEDGRPRRRLRTWVGVERMPYVREELRRIEESERREIEAAPPGVLIALGVPGESGPRPRVRKVRQG